MKLSGRSDIENLARFDSRGDLVTSFYLDTDKGRRSKKEIQVTLKNILSGAESQVRAMDIAKDRKESLLGDLDFVSAQGARVLNGGNAAGLAAFACSQRDFRLPLELPHGPRDRVVFDTTFYVRPLDAILDKYRRICLLLLGRREAKWYEVFMGEIRLLNELVSDVPKKVKEGGYEGYESKRIERHIDTHVQEHFKKAAQTTFDMFKRNGFDWLFLSSEENHHDIESFLHAYLRERVKARVKARVGDPPAKILKEVMDIEASLNRADEEGWAQRLVTELERGGLAVSGLRDTLNRLNVFEVQSLVVTHNFAKPGRICPSHKFLYVDELQCPVCGKKTDPLPDVIDEAIETSLKRNIPVRHITPPSKLDRYGSVGAFLKYKV